MTQLFRSKSCRLSRTTGGFDSSPPSPSFYHHHHRNEELEEDDDDDEEERENEDEYDLSPISTPLIVPNSRERKRSSSSNSSERRQQNNQQFQILTIFVEALKKSVATCGVEKDDICSLDISSPTDVRHVSHVTFDRFNGFLGLPVEFKPKVPTRVPSASSSVFGVSAKSMKCSYDQRGNSVPTILLMMQKRLYLEGGLQTEGIFRINAENTQEEFVRDQLNRGIVKQGIDVHCLAGLIKAWFRELPAGVLDSLTPDQVMHCNTEEESMQLMMLLQPTEAALLDWAINLMADVVQHENHNKMNARNIAMVFAPNMTQMADPLTALIHAVQVMNFLRTLIVKTIREREEFGAVSEELSSCVESANNINDRKQHPIVKTIREREESGAVSEELSSCLESANNINDCNPLLLDTETSVGSCEHPVDDCVHDKPESGNLLNFLTKDRLETVTEQNTWNLQKNGDDAGQNVTPVKCEMGSTENECRDGYTKDAEGFLDRLNLRKGVRKLRKHPVFQLSKSVKKSAEEVDI